jgi:hypothetical protein
MGRSQAIRFTSTTTVGGKAGWTPAPRLLLETREAVLEEAMAPFTDDLSWRIQPHADLVVTETGGGEEHDLGPDDVTIRRRIPARPRFQLASLSAAERDDKWARSRQALALLDREQGTKPAGSLSLQYVTVFIKLST